LKIIILLSLNFGICFNSSSDALNILFRVLNFSRSCLARVGPIPGNPSRINCFCCSFVNCERDCLNANSCGGLSNFFASSRRKFAVSSSSLVNRIGIS